MKNSEPIDQCNTQEQRSKEYWYQKKGRVTGFCFIGYSALSILLAVLTPTDILSHEWAKNLIEITGSVTPVFMDVPARSPIPDVVRFYFGVMWLLFPAFMIVMIYDSYNTPVSFMTREEAIKRLKSKLYALLFYTYLLLFTSIILYLAFTHLYEPEDGKYTRALYSSRFSLSTGGTLFNLGLLAFSWLTIVAPRVIYHDWKHLPYRQKKSVKTRH